jgi:NADPH:quinone reductase-like Zn-dependent oxidoreductase
MAQSDCSADECASAARAVALAGEPVDAIADLAGGRLLQAVLGALRPAGQVAAIAGAARGRLGGALMAYVLRARHGRDVANLTAGSDQAGG